MPKKSSRGSTTRRPTVQGVSSRGSKSRGNIRTGSRGQLVPTRRRPHPRMMYGMGFWDSLKKFGSKANRFLKKTKLISRTGKVAGLFGVPYAGAVGSVAGTLGYGSPAGATGYGRRRRRTVRVRSRKGRGIRLAGNGITTAGGRYGKKKMTGGLLPIAY